MKLFNKRNYLSLFTSHFSFQKGFTLIELLIVIAILGVLAVAVVVAINPVSKINLAKDSTVKSDMSQLVNALQAYYTTQTPALYPAALSALVPVELNIVPKQQGGAADCPAAPNGASTANSYCYVVSTPVKDKAAIWGSIFSTKDSIWCWDSTSGIYKTSTITAPTTPPTQAAPICP